MAQCTFVCLLFVVSCFNQLLAVEDLEVPDHKLAQNIEGPLEKGYSVYVCNYRNQPGYSCLSCHRALHCYPGNVALLVDCFGLFRYCRDGHCSPFQGDKCPDDNRATTSLPLLPDRFNETITPVPTHEVMTAAVEVTSPIEQPSELTTESPVKV